MQYNWEWCAAMISAVAIKLGYTDIIPTECSCTKMIELLKDIGSWEERDDAEPAPGWLVFYNWEASIVGDDTSDADHVGIVESVKDGIITVIEGNYFESVRRRDIALNHKYIRGYGVPKYDDEVAAKEVYMLEVRYLKKGCKGEDVKALQILLIGRGYSCGSAGVDGDFGDATTAAVKEYQKANGIGTDGIVGPKTMSRLLGV